MRAPWLWPALGALFCTTAPASPPGQQAVPPDGAAPAGGSPARPAGSKPSSDPDDELIEFLGSDDVGDPAWGEFLRRAAARQEHAPPQQPPQGKQQ